MSTNIVGTFPPELWHLICSKLGYRDLINVRLTCQALAVVGAEYLVSEVRFQTTPSSLKRLQCLAEHPQLRKNVKSLIYEGALIRDLACVHIYTKHYEMGIGAALRPQPPPNDATARTERLYRRNLDKFNQDAKRKYDKYANVLHAQQRLLNDAKARDQLFCCIASFPSLNSLTLATDAMCMHGLSNRFREEFGGECPAPLQWPDANSIWQLQNCLVAGLSEVNVRSVSPQFFDGLSGRADSWLHSIFSSLKIIRLTLRGTKQVSSTAADDAFAVLQDGRLKRALGAAQQLQNICLNFQIQCNEIEAQEACNIQHIFGQNSWPNLEQLEFDFVHCNSEEELIGILARQPKLSILSVAFIRLERGEWTSVARKMRDQLNLMHFFAEGVLEDEWRIFPMSMCERDAWLDEYELTVSLALDAYVGKAHQFDMSDDDDESDIEEMHFLHNPLYRIDDDFVEREELVERYGEVDTSDDDLTGVHGMEHPHNGWGDVDEDPVPHRDEFLASPLHSEDYPNSVSNGLEDDGNDLPGLVPMELD